MRNPRQCNELALVPGADRDLNVNDAPGCSPRASLSALQASRVTPHNTRDWGGMLPLSTLRPNDCSFLRRLKASLVR